MGYPGKYSDWYEPENGVSVCHKYREMADEYGDDDVTTSEIVKTAGKYVNWLFNRSRGRSSGKVKYVLRQRYLRLLQKCKRNARKPKNRYFLPKYLMFNIRGKLTCSNFLFYTTCWSFVYLYAICRLII